MCAKLPTMCKKQEKLYIELYMMCAFTQIFGENKIVDLIQFII